MEDRFKMINLCGRGNPFNIDEEDQRIKEAFENQFNNPQQFCLNNNNNNNINNNNNNTNNSHALNNNNNNNNNTEK